MRKFLLTVFWVTGLGSVIQVLVIVAAFWISVSSGNSFLDLSVDVFITQYVTWLLWLKATLIEILGSFGYWILDLPILIIAPLKLVTGTFIGLWAWSAAQEMDPVAA